MRASLTKNAPNAGNPLPTDNMLSDAGPLMDEGYGDHQQRAFNTRKLHTLGSLPLMHARDDPDDDVHDQVDRFGDGRNTPDCEAEELKAERPKAL